MCKKCGCNKCETESTALVLNESKAPASILSEGLKRHIDTNKPLTTPIYRKGSQSYFNLIAEARSLYSRGILNFTNKRDIELLTETDQGYFGIYEGKKVPLDFPMLEAEIDYEKEKTWRIQDKFPIEVTVKKGWTGNYYTIEPKPMDISYDTFIDLGSGGNVDYTSYDYTTGKARWTSNSLEQIKQWEEDNQDKIKVVYSNSLNESYDYDEVAQSEFGMDYDQLGPGEKEWVRDEIDNMSMEESLNESKIPTQDQVDKFFTLTQNETHYLNSKPVAGQEGTFNLMKVEPWDEYDLSNFNSLVRKAKDKKSKFKKHGEMSGFDMRGIDEAKFKGKTVELNKPTRGDSKKFKVYVNSGKKNADGSIKVKKVNFGHGGTSAKKAGQKTMSIRKSNPKARSAFRARHNCSSPGPKTMARYWSCKKW